ncbi:unnamed protein product, partial [Laminaria digitata]
MSITYPTVYGTFLTYVDVFNLNFGWMLSAGCEISSNFYHGLLLSTLGTFTAAVLVLISYRITCRKCPQGDQYARDRIDRRHASVLLWVSFFVYSTVSSSIFQTFACDNLDNGRSYLRADHSLECYTVTHNIFRAYAGILVVVFPFGIPFCYALVLFRGRAALRAGVSRDANTPVLEICRELWAPYRPEVYYYEIVECLRRVLLSGFVVFIFPNTAGQVATSFLLALATAAVFMILDPYGHRWHTWLARTTHAVVILSLYIALLQKVDSTNDDNSS